MARRMLSALLGLIALVAVPAAASGSVDRVDGISYVSEASVLRPTGPTTIRAACPKKTHVLSGGFYQSGGYQDAYGIHSYPYDGNDRKRVTDDGWKTELRANRRVSAVAHAVCARPMPKYVRRTVTVPANGEAVGYDVACSRESRFGYATSGGSQGPAVVRNIGGRPEATKIENLWETSLVNDGGGERDVTVSAVCSQIPTAAAAATVSAPSMQQTLVTAQCPAQVPRLLGGGFLAGATAPVRGGTAIASSSPTNTTASPLGWNTWVDNSSSFNFSVAGIAICGLAPQR